MGPSFLLTRRVLLFVESDDAKQFPEYTKSRTWSPRHLVFVFVLQDLDRPFLRDVHCGVLLRVRNLAEIGRMFGLHDLCLPSLWNCARRKECLPCFRRRTTFGWSLFNYVFLKLTFLVIQCLQRV